MGISAQQLEPASSLVGQLQRGLGSGYLAALNTSPRVVARLVSRLTIEDPRWDRQLDSREDYYGQLALWSGMSVEPLRRHLQQHDDALEPVLELRSLVQPCAASRV